MENIEHSRSRTTMKNNFARALATRLITIVAMLGAPIVYAQTASVGGVTQKEVQFYSESVLCYGKLFLPRDHSEASKSGAVILAPGARQTAASLDKLALEIANRGVVAMTFDYRGWGKSGGFLYFGEAVQWDDRLRFSQSTTKMRIVRNRLVPQAQVIDFRNAITFLQGEPGIDRARIGVWGVDLSGGHAIVVAGVDARIKAVVAQAPLLDGNGKQRKAFAPTAEQQAAMIKLARTGAAPSTTQAALAMNTEESKLAFAEYHPFWYLDQIATTTAVRFIVADNEKTDAAAAAAVLKGVTDVVTTADAKTIGLTGASAAAEWFAKNL